MTALQAEQGYIPDKLKKAEKRLDDNPYDVEAWSIIIRDAQTKKIEDARPVYENLVSQFPNAGRYWKLYIEQEVLYHLDKVYLQDDVSFMPDNPVF